MHTLIFLNGTMPGTAIINRFLKKKCYVIAADGGANYLKRAKITPDIIIGDLDSIRNTAIKYFQSKNVLIKKVEDQNNTDFDKCLLYCIESGRDSIFVFGATSMRPDHTLNNYSILLRYYKKLEIKIITDQFEIFFIRKKISFPTKPGEIVSLLAIPQSSGITTTGLQYLLKNEDLEFGVREGTLNRAISNEVTVSFKSGNLLLFKKHPIQ